MSRPSRTLPDSLAPCRPLSFHCLSLPRTLLVPAESHFLFHFTPLTPLLLTIYSHSGSSFVPQPSSSLWSLPLSSSLPPLTVLSSVGQLAYTFPSFRARTVGYQKPRLALSSASRSAARVSILFRLFFSLVISTLIGLSLPIVLQAMSFNGIYLGGYLSLFLTIWSILSGQLLFPIAIDALQLFSFEQTCFNRSHVSHMRIDRLRRLSDYQDPRAECYSLHKLFTIPAALFFSLRNHTWAFVASSISSFVSLIVLTVGFYSEDTNTISDNDYTRSETINMGGLGLYSVSDGVGVASTFYLPHAHSFRLRGGFNSDDDDSEDYADQSDDLDSDCHGAGLSSKRKRKTAQAPRPRKRPSKGKELWDVPDHRVAIILDVSDTPECLQGDRKLMSIDAYIKKQCQDAWTGLTGSKKTGLALVTILDPDEDKVIQCRRSNLKCNGFYTCSLASPDHLLGFERKDAMSDTATQELISRPLFESKNAEGIDIVAIASAFYRSTTNQYCKAKGDGDGQFQCGGHAVMRKYHAGKCNGKEHFIGCSNWSQGDGLSHRFTKIPPQVRESILRSLFRDEEIMEDDTEVVDGYCSAIIHPSHLPRNKECARIHYRDNKSVVGHLEAQTCPAELLILIPVDENDLQAVVIPKAGIQHNHPAFVRSKTPFQVAQKYKKAAETTGVIGQTTLCIDKEAASSASQRAIFGFDYEAALKSDILESTLHRIAYGTSDPVDVPMYPIGDSEDEIFASDPYTPSQIG
ncbi:hypothetical protein B0H12DRAFT_1245450 [Mycena haematopus]|nr:hypothetical protein B0H12DRAFT_1245450 [Mycena haematopus]